jgi:hypothetical protein
MITADLAADHRADIGMVLERDQGRFWWERLQPTCRIDRRFQFDHPQQIDPHSPSLTKELR